MWPWRTICSPSCTGRWATGLAAGAWPRPGGELVTGGSPRYQIYRTSDGRFLAAAPLEQKFWENFCEAIGLEAQWRDDGRDAHGTRNAIARRVAGRTAAAWSEALAGKDVCCAIVASVEEALADAHFQARGLFAQQLATGNRAICALPVPIDPAFRRAAALGYPALGEDNTLIEN